MAYFSVCLLSLLMNIKGINSTNIIDLWLGGDYTRNFDIIGVDIESASNETARTNYVYIRSTCVSGFEAIKCLKIYLQFY